MYERKTDNAQDRRNNLVDDRRSSNVVWCNTDITKDKRNKLNKQQSAVLWFTGLSGSGKSTIANAVEEYLHRNCVRTYILDGDNVRHGLNGDLGFSDEDRKENIRRIAEVASLFVDAGTIVLSAFISPFKEDRFQVKELVGEDNFIEVFVDCPLEECEKRDVKGLYAKARKGEIKNFTGIDSPFEKPDSPMITVETHKISIDIGVKKILEVVNKKILI